MTTKAKTAGPSRMAPRPNVRRQTDRAMKEAGLGMAGRFADRVVKRGLQSGMSRKEAISNAVRIKGKVKTLKGTGMARGEARRTAAEGLPRLKKPGDMGQPIVIQPDPGPGPRGRGPRKPLPGGKVPFDGPTRPGMPPRRGPITRPLPGVPQPDPAKGRGTIGPKLKPMKGRAK